jgi:hypothetical protein
MAGFAAVPEEDRWHIVNYVLSIPIDGAFFDEHGHQYHGGDNSHAAHDHARPHKHSPAKNADKPADKPPADSKTTRPEPPKDKK